MDSGKALILSAISKRQTAFKAYHIVDATGLDRQLVHYHLSKFVDKGWLQKTSTYYMVIDLSNIIDELLDVAQKDSGSSSKPEQGNLLISNEFAKRTSAMVQEMVQGVVLDVPMAKDYKEVVITNIDLSLEFFRQLKKFANNYQPSINVAAEHFHKDRSMYERMTEVFKMMPTLDEAVWKGHVAEKAEDIVDNA